MTAAEAARLAKASVSADAGPQPSVAPSRANSLRQLERSNTGRAPAQLLQHTSQVSIMLVAVKAEEAELKRIGFVLLKKLEDNAQP
ncbi:hypothetical protein N185_34395 [Sinorhizobium sp. GW3]|nr:hypothetical protein N185_34395 [Sinorhizobium sp. GW3]